MPLTYTRIISDEDVKAVEHYVVDFKEWIDTAITMKIANRKQALIKEVTDKLVVEGRQFPGGTVESVLETVFNSENYKNRKRREADEKEKLNGKPA